MKCKGKGLRPPHPCTPTSSGEQSRRLWRAFLEATADAAVRARRVAAVDVERTAILALVIVTATAQARTPTNEVPVIRDIGRLTAVCRAREQCPFKTACCRNGEVGRIARRGRADQRAIRAVAEVVGIADDIQAVNAKQENLFIGMIHAFQYMGIPRYVLTDNMKSVVLHRDLDGRPVWQKDYEAFMRTVGFDTKLCKPRHPFTKGAVERLIRFVKENFLSDRVFCDVTDLNWQALEWCNAQNGIYHRAVDGVPQQIHDAACSSHLRRLPDSDEVRGYLCPNRRISFDGFVNYEGRRFGVPYSYAGSTARVMRSGDTLYIYSTDMNSLLATHAVTWSHRDSFCEGQYEVQPEEFPTAPVKTQLRQLPKPASNLSFAKFDFDDEEELL